MPTFNDPGHFAMRFFNRFSQGELRLNRIEALSDGVFAIIITLLVFGLKVPSLHDAESVGELGRKLAALLPKFLSWMISFVIVCKFWLNHHHILSLAHHATYGLVWLNSIFLMFQSFIPFPTLLIGEYPNNSLAVSLFGAVLGVNALLLRSMYRYILRHLATPEVLAELESPIISRARYGPLFYFGGAAIAWLDPRVTFAMFLCTPLFFIFPQRRRRDLIGTADPTSGS